MRLKVLDQMLKDLLEVVNGYHDALPGGKF